MTDSRRKGAKGELELRDSLQALGIDAHRTRQFCGKNGTPDVEIPGLRGYLHIECKRTERLRLHDAMKQSTEDAPPGAVPTVIHRRNRDEWMLTLKLEHLWDFFHALSLIAPERLPLALADYEAEPPPLLRDD